jgi:hypothetical protein
MIVRDRGGDWQVVLQTDHADLSAAFARAWRTSLPPSLVIAAERHDDGWAVWEQAPRVDADGKPVNFLEVDILSHLAFYRAGIAAITEQDEDAGLLVSMHGAGIYRQRYGLDPGLGLARASEAQTEVDAFVAEQEAKFSPSASLPHLGPRLPASRAPLPSASKFSPSASLPHLGPRLPASRAPLPSASKFGGGPGDRWEDYELLQLYDRLSLYFCMRDVEAGEAAELQGYDLEPLGPWAVRLAPFPFAERPARFSLLRRLVPKNGRPEILATAPEHVEITIEP